MRCLYRGLGIDISVIEINLSKPYACMHDQSNFRENVPWTLLSKCKQTTKISTVYECIAIFKVHLNHIKYFETFLQHTTLLPAVWYQNNVKNKHIVDNLKWVFFQLQKMPLTYLNFTVIRPCNLIYSDSTNPYSMLNW